MGARLDPDARAGCPGGDLGRASRAQRGQSLFRLFETVRPASNCVLPQGADIGQAHAVGRQDAREGVHEHRLHAQRIGDEAGMLPARAAEACSA
jgi:hypothetical protein